MNSTSRLPGTPAMEPVYIRILHHDTTWSEGSMIRFEGSFDEYCGLACLRVVRIEQTKLLDINTVKWNMPSTKVVRYK